MKRKSSSGHDRPSKRHKPSLSHGKTELQIQQEQYDRFLKEEEERKMEDARRALEEEQQQRQNQQQQPSQQTYTNTNTYADNTPLSSDDDDDDDDDQIQQKKQIIDGSDDEDDDDDDLMHQSHDHNNNNNQSYIHPERSSQMIKPAPAAAPPRASASGSTTTGVDDGALTYRDLRSVQMRRNQLEKLCVEPYFSSFITGLYCRVYIGDRIRSSGSKCAIYRICEILGVEQYSHPYKLSDRRTVVTIGLLIAHGRSSRVFKLVQTSNESFRESEFTEWCAAMKRDRIQLPTRDYLSSIYLDAIRMHKNFIYTDADLAIMRKQKMKNFNAANLANPNREKLRIQTVINSLSKDDPKRNKFIIYLDDINREINNRKSMANESRSVSIASINERNKTSNRKLLRRARDKQSNKRKQTINNELDPFTRSLTAPQIESFQANNLDEIEKKIKMEKEKAEKELKLKQEIEKQKKEKEKTEKLSILNDAKLELELELDANTNATSNCSLIKDKLWNQKIHIIAKKFINSKLAKNININIKSISIPQFGRNTAPSNYASKYTKPPRNCQILTVDEYLASKKYA